MYALEFASNTLLSGGVAAASVIGVVTLSSATLTDFLSRVAAAPSFALPEVASAVCSNNGVSELKMSSDADGDTGGALDRRACTFGRTCGSQ